MTGVQTCALPISVKTFNGTVTRVSDLTHDIRLLEIEIEKPLRFCAGQYVDLGITGWLQAALELTGAKGVVVDCENTKPEGAEGAEGAEGTEGTEAFRHCYRLEWKA